MKKSIKMLASAFAIVAVASCSKETAGTQEIINGDSVQMELTVAIDGQTKASFASQARQLAWQEGDQVAVFDGTAKQVFTVKAETIDGGSAVFSGQVTAGAQDLYVAYPVAAAASCSSDGVAVTIPSQQTVPSGENSDPNAFVMVGKVSEEGNVALKNVVSLVKCSLTSAASSVTIKCDGAISGEVTANPLTGAAAVSNASSSVTATGAFEAGSSVYVAVAPATVEGFKVVIRNESGRFVKSTAKSATFKQNGILSIGNVDADAVAVPDEISNYDQYKTFVENSAYYSVDDTVKLVANIDMAEKSITPVPSFSATFNGCNHTLSNVTIDNVEELPAGLFSVLSGATVKNLVLDNIKVSSTYVEVGAVAGNASNSTFENISVTGGSASVITSSAKFTPNPATKYGTLYDSSYAVVGGLVGSITGGEVKNCAFGGTATAENRSVGGIAGFAGSAPVLFKDCTLTADGTAASPKGTNVGGIVGISISSALTLDSCHCLGTVTAGYSYVGGIAGSVTNATVTNCEAVNASITDTAAASGSVSAIVAYAEGGTVTFESCVVDKCTVKGGFGIGGILGHSGQNSNVNVTIKNCHVKNGTKFESLHTNAYTGGLVGRTNTKTQKIEIVDSDVLNSTLVAVGPQIGGVIGCGQAVTTTLNGVVSDGNSVSSTNGTAYCAGLVGCHYGANATFTDCSAKNLTITVPEATNSNSSFFVGRATSACTKLELIRPVVENGTLTAPKGQTNGGLMGYLDAANFSVKDAVVKNITIDCVRRYVGGVVGNIVNTVKTVVVDGFELSGSTIKVVGNVSGENQNYTGGVVGYMSGSVTEVTVKNAIVSRTDIIGNRAYVGGLFGTSSAKSVIIENSVVGSSCRITGSYSIGGITGGAFFGNGSVMKINNCTCYADVTGSNFQVGGIVGLVNNNALTSVANVSVTNCSYIGGTVKSTHAGLAHVGGIIGKSGGLEGAGKTNRTQVYVVNCCSKPGLITGTAATPLTSTSEAYVGGIMGHMHSGTNVYACFSAASSSTIAANGLNAYPVWGIAEDFASRYNTADKLYYGNGFTVPGYFVTAGDASSVGAESLPFTGGTLLTKLNEAADSYNASPLFAGTSAVAWTTGSDGAPALTTQIADPDNN